MSFVPDAAGVAKAPPGATLAKQGGAVIRVYRAGDEVGISRVMTEVYPGRSGEDTLVEWRWKHSGRPGFTPEDILVADAQRRIVGCFHATLDLLEIENGLQIRVSYNGDWAVVKEFRGTDLTGPAWDLTSQMQRERGAVLRVGFATEQVNERFYRGRFGSVFVPSTTVRLRRLIGLPAIEARIKPIGERLLARRGVRRALRERPWILDFELERFPRFTLHLNHEGLSLVPGRNGDANLRLRGSFLPIAAFPDGVTALAGTVIRETVTRRLRVRGIVRAGVRLFAFVVAVAWASLWEDGQSGNGLESRRPGAS